MHEYMYLYIPAPQCCWDEMMTHCDTLCDTGRCPELHRGDFESVTRPRRSCLESRRQVFSSDLKHVDLSDEAARFSSLPHCTSDGGLTAATNHFACLSERLQHFMLKNVCTTCWHSPMKVILKQYSSMRTGALTAAEQQSAERKQDNITEAHSRTDHIMKRERSV